MPFTSSLAPFATSNNRIVTWGSAISSGCVAAGLRDENPVGRINWNAISSSAATNFTYGFDVFSLDDSLSATHPVYIRIDYQNGTLTALKPRTTITVGTTHDGSGSVGGNSRSFQLQFTGGGLDENLWPLYFAAGSGWANICLFGTLSIVNTQYIGIQRTIDENGNLTPDGIMINLMGQQNGSDPSQCYIPYSGSLPPIETRWGIMISPTNDPANNTDNNRMLIGRIYHFNGRAIAVPTTTCVALPRPSFAPQEIFDMPLFAGVTGSYLTFGTSEVVNASLNYIFNSAIRIS